MKLAFINEAKRVVKRVVKSVVKRAVKSEVQTADIYKQNKTKLKENTANAVQKKTACGEFGNVLLTKNELEKLKIQYPQDFEAIIGCFSSYVEFKHLSKASLIGNPKMGSFGILQAKNAKKILWNF